MANKTVWYDPYYRVGANLHHLISSTSILFKKQRYADLFRHTVSLFLQSGFEASLLSLRGLANLAWPTARQRRHTPVRGTPRPFAIRLAAEHPALERRLKKTIGFALVEGLLE
jgi:hypothetical protein